MNITKQKIFPLLMVAGITLSGASQAALIDRGNGLIYDDVLDITWLQDANYAKTSGYDADGKMSWSAANTWAANLSYGGYDDWRLPNVSPVNNTSFEYDQAHDGSKDRGFNITSTQSEMAYMYHVNLNNVSLFDTSGTPRMGNAGIDWGLVNTGLFNNIQSFIYWSAVEYQPNTSEAWMFDTIGGNQSKFAKFFGLHAWAVRSGDVAVSAVPIPAAFWLMVSGLLGIAGLRKK